MWGTEKSRTVPDNSIMSGISSAPWQLMDTEELPHWKPPATSLIVENKTSIPLTEKKPQCVFLDHNR